MQSFDAHGLGFDDGAVARFDGEEDGDYALAEESYLDEDDDEEEASDDDEDEDDLDEDEEEDEVDFEYMLGFDEEED